MAYKEVSRVEIAEAIRAGPIPRSATGPGGPAPPPSHSRPAVGRPSTNSDRQIPRAPLPMSSKSSSQAANTRRCVLRLLASALLATDTRAYPKSFPLIFRCPPVLAWRRDATAGGVLAMLENVPFRQGWPSGRPGPEGGVDHRAQSSTIPPAAFPVRQRERQD